MSRKFVLLISALAVSCVLLLAAWGSVRIPFAQDRANSYLHKNYPLFDIDFDAARLTWKPGGRRVDLHLDNVTVTDIAGDDVAGIPALVVSIEPFSLFSSDPRPQVIRLEQPSIRLERTAGGALKVDVGPTGDGSSGTLELAMLIDFANQSEDLSRDADPPEIQMVDAQLTLIDERSGARFAFSPVNLILNRTNEGLRADATLRARTGGEMLDISLSAVFRMRDKSVWLTTDFTNANPAILSELLPGLKALEPIEIALSGRATMVLDGEIALRTVDLLVWGGPGSVELAQYTGANIALTTLRANLSYLGTTDRLLISNLSLDLGGRHLTGSLSSTPSDAAHRTFTGDLMLRNTAWGDVMPMWFATLDRLETAASVSVLREGTEQRLRFETAMEAQTGRLEGLGLMTFGSPPPESMAENGNEDMGTATTRSIQVFIAGTLMKPQITLGAFRTAPP